MSSAKVARVIRRLAIWVMHLALSDTFPIGTMLRIHLPQNWFSLSDPAMEEALYEIT